MGEDTIEGAIEGIRHVLEDYAEQFYMPARLYPAFSLQAFLSAPLVMLMGTQIAALLPSLRILRLNAAAALRGE